MVFGYLSSNIYHTNMHCIYTVTLYYWFQVYLKKKSQVLCLNVFYFSRALNVNSKVSFRNQSQNIFELNVTERDVALRQEVPEKERPSCPGEWNFQAAVISFAFWFSLSISDTWYFKEMHTTLLPASFYL